ncbi:MAG: AraC family transcriptional regulator [Verrucomicrobia bacterium]|nr:AraC family transcriptional regulator [Verrucomicrobiota bacterium]
MNEAKKTMGGIPFGEILLCGERNHGQYPPLEDLRILHEFVIVYLFEGSGIYWDAKQSMIELGPGSCLVIPPQTPHAYHPLSPARWSEIFFVFKGALFDTWQAHGLLPSQTQHLALRPTDYWLPKFRNALTSGSSSSDSLTDCCRLQLVLADINNFIGQSRYPEEDLVWLEQAKYWIETSLVTNPSLAEPAARMRVSYDHFRKRFKKTSGISPSAYRTQVQINQASKLLLQTRIPIGRIAEQLGFCDVFHLSKRFKQSTGFSPQQYRKRF